MSRLSIPHSIEAAPEKSQPLLEAVNKKLGTVPNLFRLISNSPSALEGYLGLSEALSKGKISAATGERIALAVAQVNGCSYCLSAHSFLAKNLAKLDQSEIDANRDATSLDPKAAAAVKFATNVAKERGHIKSECIEHVKQAGYSEEEIIEIVLHVALNTWTNYINEVAKTDIDFPVVTAKQ